MISPSAMVDAAKAAGMWPWELQREVDGIPVSETLWHLPGDPIGVPLGHPYMVSVVASWLRSNVVAAGGDGALERYMRACMRLDPSVVGRSVVFTNDDFTIGAAMVTLGHWSEQYARLVLRTGWMELDENKEGEPRCDVVETD